MGGKTKLIDAADQGSLDGFRVDRDGNLWCGWGSNGALQPEPTEIGGRKVFQLKGKSEDLDGVMVFNAEGKPLGLHPAARTLRQPRLRRPEEQPLLYDELPLGLCAVRARRTAAGVNARREPGCSVSLVPASTSGERRAHHTSPFSAIPTAHSANA